LIKGADEKIVRGPKIKPMIPIDCLPHRGEPHIGNGDSSNLEKDMLHRIDEETKGKRKSLLCPQ